MGVKTSVAGVTLAANHITMAAAAGQDASALQSMAKLRCDEAIVALRALVATMHVGDGNIATINTQITALS